VFRHVALRVLSGAGTLLAVSVLIFFGTELLPGDPARAILGREAQPAQLQELRREFGLDRPVATRYGEWLGGIATADLGRSFPSGDPVTSVIAGKVRNTAILAVATLALLIPLGIVLGVLSAVRPGGWLDHGIAATTLTFIATPEFVVGSVLILIFAVWLSLVPPVSLIEPGQSFSAWVPVLVLPVLTLLLNSVAQMIRMVRATMIEVLDSSYVEIARLKGVPERRVLFRHALPNILAPTIQIIALSVAWLAGGVVIVEALFGIRGVGLTLTEAVSRRDLPTVQALAMLVALIYVGMNLLADVVVVFLNPRLRHG
jgi:peptide/nickel transport system permease protein